MLPVKPGFAPGIQSLLDQEYARALQDKPNSLQLTDELNGYLQRLRRSHDKDRREGRFENTPAGVCGSLAFDLIARHGHLDSDAQSLVAAAVRYFLIEDDREPDSDPIFGWDDDLHVLREILAYLDRLPATRLPPTDAT